MFIRVKADKSIELQALNDFQNFKVVSLLDQSNLSALSEALNDLAVVESHDMAWVWAQALSARIVPAPEVRSLAHCNSMIEGASRYGYIRDNPLAIGAHIERETP